MTPLLQAPQGAAPEGRFPGHEAVSCFLGNLSWRKACFRWLKGLGQGSPLFGSDWSAGGIESNLRTQMEETAANQHLSKILLHVMYVYVCISMYTCLLYQ